MTRITRVEVITNNGREYVSWEDDNDIVTSIQDNGRTLKVFVNKVKPKTGEEGALEALDKFQNDWLLGKKCPETKLEIKKLDSVESIKAEIKMLQSKLSFYEELEKQPKTLFDVIRNLGYSVDMCYEIVDAVEEFEKQKEREMIKRNLKTSLQEMVNGDVRPIDDVVKEAKEEQKWDVVRESVKWCEENPEKSVEDYLTPKTPEKTEQSLKTAFKEAQQTEKWKETQKKIDTPKESWMDKPVEELVDKLMENPPDCLKFQLGKTLEQIVNRWWCDTFTGSHENWSMEECIDDLVDQIQLWLPKEQSAAGSQSLGVEDMVEGFNDCLRKIKSKLRNKNDTF
jgi:hypothetical protein